MEIKTKFLMWSHILKTWFQMNEFLSIRTGLNLIQEIYLTMPYKRIVLANRDGFFPRHLIDRNGEKRRFYNSESKVLSITSPHN